MPHRLHKSLSAGFMPDPDLNLLEWADEFFELPRESTAEYGKFRSDRTPFIREILLELSPSSKTEIVVLIKPTQLAGTTAAIIFLMGTADLYPGPSLCILPTDTKAKSFSKKKLAPSIKLMPRLRAKIKEAKTRDSGNTILEKTFPGGSWLLTGSNSGASYRAESIKFLVLDDFDAFESDVEGEGSPDELADRRTGSFPGRKIFINTTVTIKQASNGERVFEKSSQGYYHVPCPHCGFYQYLEFGTKDSKHGIKFDRDEGGAVTTAWYVCKCCQTRIDEAEKPWMTENGEYVHQHPDRKVRGFRYNAFLTPIGWVNSWGYIAQKFVDAIHELRKGDPQSFVTWLNSFAAESYEPKGDRKTAEFRRLQEDRPAGLVPSAGPIHFIDQHGNRDEKRTYEAPGVLGLTAGIDTQDNGFWFVIHAWGRNLESWLIRYGFIELDFELLDEIILKSTYLDTAGNQYPVLFSLQDAMGHKTSEVYDFVRTRSGIMACRGDGKMAQKWSLSTIDTYPGTNKPIPGGVKLLRLNSQMFKDRLSSKIQVNPGDPGAFHLHNEIYTDYTSQMTAEFINDKGQWDCPPSKPNHVWDCTYMALAAADYIGIAHAGEPRPAKGQRRPDKPKRPGGGRVINPWKMR
uniref:Putative terminase n=1 Tax=viral metagenome TaxID=1070528 RepID=A0A6M3J2A4_9ZZZZ